MKPNRLTLSGFKGIRDGLGMKQFTLELGDANGLFALKGRNGRGKTTLIDNLQPYRLLPSKVDGTWSTKAASFYESLEGSSATKDLLWTHDGRTFHTINEWKMSGKTRSCVAHLFETVNGAETPYVLSDGVTCDGKTDTYDRAIEEILGPPEVFFTSAFSAQGKKPISAMQPGDAKKWLGNLLNQAPVRALGERARSVSKQLGKALANLREACADLPGLRAELTNTIASIAANRESLVLAVAQRIAADQDLAKAELALAQASADDGPRVALEQRRARAAELVASARQRVKQVDDDVKRLLAHEEARVRAAVSERQRFVDAAARTRQSLLTPVEHWQALLGRKDQIVSEQKVREALLIAVDEREQTLIPVARAQLQHKVTQEQELRTRTAALDGKRKDYLALQGIAVRAEKAEKVPCHGTPMNASCELLCDARAAHSQEPDARAKLGKLASDGETEKADLARLADAISKLQDPRNVLDGLEAKQREDQTRLRQMAGVPALVESLTTAAQQLEQANVALKGFDLDHAAELAQREQVEIAMKAQSTESVERARAAHLVETAALVRAESELNAVPAADGLSVQALQQVLEKATARVTTSREREMQLQSDISNGCSSEVTLRARIAAKESSAMQCGRVEEQVELWNTLAEALGDKGIIALEIDAAGPTIAMGANKLLAGSHGPRFSVELATQVAAADGTMKEGFDIVVHDAESNDTRSMAHLSGGQRIWVNEAIIRSVAIYLAQAGQRHYDTLFTDEVDGALDPERKHAFMSMKLALLRMGYFSREIFITQTPELLDYADRVIDLDALATTP